MYTSVVMGKTRRLHRQATKRRRRAAEEIPVATTLESAGYSTAHILQQTQAHFNSRYRSSITTIAQEALSSMPSVYGFIAGLSSAAALSESVAAGVSVACAGFSVAVCSRERSIIKKDRKKVENIKAHFDRHNNHHILHALDYQAEGFSPEEDHPAEYYSLKPYSYEKRFCVRTRIDFEEVMKAGGSSEECAGLSSGQKLLGFSKEMLRDSSKFFKNPKLWNDDVQQGVLSASCLAWYGKRTLQDKVEDFFEAPGAHLWYAQRCFQDAVVDVFGRRGETELVKSFDKVGRGEDYARKRRLQRERAHLQKRLKDTYVESGLTIGAMGSDMVFTCAESVQAVCEISNGNYPKGLAHTAAVVFSLDPIRFLGLRVRDQCNNISSKRSEAARESDAPDVEPV